MRLVADALEKVQFWRVWLKDDGFWTARLEDFLVAFGERTEWDVWQLVADFHLFEHGYDR